MGHYFNFSSVLLIRTSSQIHVAELIILDIDHAYEKTLLKSDGFFHKEGYRVQTP